MPGDEDMQWVKSTANELNNLLQVISESSQVLETICAESPDTEKYFSILRSGVERAAKVTRMMVDRVGGYQAEPTSPISSISSFSPVKPPEPPQPVILPTVAPPKSD